MDPWCAVRTAPSGMRRTDMDQQGLVALLPAGRRSVLPGVVAAPGDPEHAAQAPEAELVAVDRHEVELHFWSSAK